MPGRSCVALTLLICSLERWLISEIPAGSPLCDAVHAE
jgi:hypothetical protein